MCQLYFSIEEKRGGEGMCEPIVQEQLIVKGIEETLKIGEYCITNIRKKIVLKREIEKIVEKYIKNTGNDTRKARRKITKKIKKVIKVMNRESIEVKGCSERQEFCIRCREILEVSKKEISDEVITELFENIWKRNLIGLSEEEQINNIANNVKKISDRNFDSTEDIKEKMVKLNDGVNRIGDEVGKINNILVANVQMHSSSDEIAFINYSLAKSESFSGSVHVMETEKKEVNSIHKEVTENEFYNLLQYVEKKRNKRKYRQLIGRELLLRDIKNWLDNIKEGEISFCSLIGPGGAGKTHIGWEITRESMSDFRTFYFEKESFSRLEGVIQRYEEDIEIKENILFILDYVYEQIDIIRKLIAQLENNRCKYKVAMMFIERDTTMEYSRNFLPASKKFFINMSGETESASYWLSDQNLEEIMRQLLNHHGKNEEEEKYIEEFCRSSVIQLTESIDKIYRRPIFLTFIAEICEEDFLNNRVAQIDMQSLDSVMERYWSWKNEILLRGDYLNRCTREEIINIKEQCEIFFKVLLVCASVLEHNICIKYESNKEFPFTIEIERALGNYRKYLIPFMEKIMRRIPVEFLKTQDFISYMEKLCKTHMFVPNGFNFPVMIIRPEKDILSEWIVYKEYSMRILGSFWLKELISILRNYVSKGLVALVYRGALDFPSIVEILKWIDREDDFDRILIFCQDLLLALVNKELKDETVSNEMKTVTGEVIKMLSQFDDYYNVDYDIKEQLREFIVSKVKVQECALDNTLCFEIISRLPERK